MFNQKWWELLTDDELKFLAEEFPNFKEYENPTLDMKTRLDFYYIEKEKNN